MQWSIDGRPLTCSSVALNSNVALQPSSHPAFAQGRVGCSVSPKHKRLVPTDNLSPIRPTPRKASHKWVGSRTGDFLSTSRWHVGLTS